MHSESFLASKIQVLLFFKSKTQGKTKLDISFNGRLIRLDEKPARLAERINKGGDSFPSISGKPAVSDSAEWGLCKSLQIERSASNRGSSCVFAAEISGAVVVMSTIQPLKKNGIIFLN